MKTDPQPQRSDSCGDPGHSCEICQGATIKQHDPYIHGDLPNREQPPATDEQEELTQEIKRLNIEIDSERSRRVAAQEAITLHWQPQLMAALAAIAEHNRIHHTDATLHAAITVDLSALDKYVAEKTKPMVDALGKVRQRFPVAANTNQLAIVELIDDALAKVKTAEDSRDPSTPLRMTEGGIEG